MSNLSGFKQKMLSGEILAGTFLKTPNYILVEVLAQSKLDFICLDAEHSPFDRAALDQCLACLLYTSPSPRDLSTSRMPSSA